MLADFRDYIKTLDMAEKCSIGKIENSKEKVFGIYSVANLMRVEAFGNSSSYDIAGFQILVHWNKNMNETEVAARNLFEAIRYIRNVEMGNKYVYLIRLDDGEPNFIGTDDNGVYEYHISGKIYYRR